MAETILVIDDDAGLLLLMQLGLSREGFSVITAESGKEGLRKAYEHRPDVIILDIMMAEMDGWTTCQRLRNVCDTPIIFLTAKSGGEDVVKGLSLGADDYLTKPCSFDELKARIHTVLRRRKSQPSDGWKDFYDDGHLRVDFTNGTVIRQGQVLDLTPTESRLLLYLAGQKGRIVSHEELLTNIWGPEYMQEVQYLSVYIRYLRQKIEDDPANPRYICTRWKVGYYFVDHGGQQPQEAE